MMIFAFPSLIPFISMDSTKSSVSSLISRTASSNSASFCLHMLKVPLEIPTRSQVAVTCQATSSELQEPPSFCGFSDTLEPCFFAPCQPRTARGRPILSAWLRVSSCYSQWFASYFNSLFFVLKDWLFTLVIILREPIYAIFAQKNTNLLHYFLEIYFLFRYE